MVVTREMTIVGRLGLHARPSAMFTNVASRFDCDVTVQKGDVKVSGKSLIGLMTLEAGMGTRLKVTADGADAERALDALEDVLKKDFANE